DAPPGGRDRRDLESLMRVRRAYLPETELFNLPSSPPAREDPAARFQGELSGYSTSMLNLFLSRSGVTVNFSGVDSSFWYFGWIGERLGLPSSGRGGGAISTLYSPSMAPSLSLCVPN